MKLRLGRLIVSCLLALLFLSFLADESYAESNQQRIYDHAELLTEEQIKELETIAGTYSEKREVDFIIVTVEDPGKDMQKYVDEFYDEEGFGFDKKHGNTAMLGIGMKERDVVLSGFKEMEESLDPNRLSHIREKITPALSDGNYFDAFESFILLSSKYMMYRPGVDPTNPLFNTWVQLGIALAVAALIVWAMARNVEPKMTATSATYQDMNRSRVVRKRDRYIRKTVTRRRKPKQSSGGNRGGGGSGSIGRTSAGHARSTSRGKF